MLSRQEAEVNHSRRMDAFLSGRTENAHIHTINKTSHSTSSGVDEAEKGWGSYAYFVFFILFSKFSSDEMITKCVITWIMLFQLAKLSVTMLCYFISSLKKAKVNISEMTWEQRERVLRLLFAKMNRLKSK